MERQRWQAARWARIARTRGRRGDRDGMRAALEQARALDPLSARLFLRALMAGPLAAWWTARLRG